MSSADRIMKGFCCSGFSLVELLVALLLGLILSAGVINLFIEQKSNVLETEEMARLQENGRYALHLLSKEASLSGFYGGQINLDEINLAAGGVVTEGCAKNVLEPISFVDHKALGTLSTYIPCVDATANNVSSISDVLVVRRVSGSPTVFDGDVLGTINDAEEYFRIVDYGADIAFLQGSSASTGGGIAPGINWSLWEYESKAFYVNNNDELCQKTMTQFDTSVEECFLAGIEALQFEFGIEDASGNIQYKSTPTAGELESAVSLRIYLLAKTSLADGNYTDDKTYNIANLDDDSIPPGYAPNDHYRRRIYTATVLLRNPVTL